MKQRNYRVLAFALFIAITVSGPAAAQSSDRDHPTRVESNEIKGDLDNSGNEYFYSFSAGPGELTLTVDVKSSSGTAVLNFELLEKNGATALICCEFAQADSDGKTGRDIKSIKIAKKQTVILHATVGKTGTGTYRIRLSGSGAPEK